MRADKPVEGYNLIIYAPMAELADAYGSGPYEWKFVQVQVLLGAPLKKAIH